MCGKFPPAALPICLEKGSIPALLATPSSAQAHYMNESSDSAAGLPTHPEISGGVYTTNGDHRAQTPSQILAYQRPAAAWPLENAVKWIHTHVFSSRKITAEGADFNVERRQTEALLNAGALQNAIFNSANFSSIATDAKGVIQIFNVGAERMLGYTAAEVVNKITPADISDPQELIVRALALSAELSTTITPGFEALVFKAARGIEDIYELTYIRKDGSRFPAIV